MFHGKLDTGQTDVEISVVFGETPLSPVPEAHRLSAAVGAVQTEQSQPPFWICTADPRPRSGPFCHLWLWTVTFCRATRDAKTPGLGLCVYRFFFDRNQSRNLQTDLPRPPPEPSTNPEHPVPPDQNLQTDLPRPPIRSRPDQNLQSYLGRTAKANLPKPPGPTKIRRPAKNQALAELADLPVPALPEICPVLGFFWARSGLDLDRSGERFCRALWTAPSAGSRTPGGLLENTEPSYFQVVRGEYPLPSGHPPSNETPSVTRAHDFRSTATISPRDKASKRPTSVLWPLTPRRETRAHRIRHIQLLLTDGYTEI